MRYVYSGTDPQEDPDGGVARPLDVREFAEPPEWGAWSLLPDDAPQATESAAEAPAAQSSASAAETVPAPDQDAPAPSGTEG